MKLEKYGIKMQGLKKAAGETKHLDYWNGYTQISYDRADGEVMAEYHIFQTDSTFVLLCPPGSRWGMQRPAGGAAGCYLLASRSRRS